MALESVNPPAFKAMLDWKPSDGFPPLREQLRDHLLQSVLPFWLHHAIDPAGGINTCVRDDGTVVSREKWLWSQWRAVWVFSKLFNDIEPNEAWLDVARGVYQFCRQHGWDEQVSGWRLRLGHDGAVLAGCESIYVDAFAIYGLTELAKAIGETQPLDLARRTADSALLRLQASHDTIPHFPYPVPKGARVHGLPMIFSLVFWELGQLVDEPRYNDAALAMTRDIREHFYRPARDLLLERIAENNQEYPPPLGTVVIPGHVLEDMWFQIHIARDLGDTHWIDEACRMIRRHFELGWDRDYGGIILAIDADGRRDVGWKLADMKVWWPQVEAMYALLLAHEFTKDSFFLDAYEKVHRYNFSHFPVMGHGEWTQNLDRRGRPIQAIPSLPVKDPFHLPRALIYCVEVLNRHTG